MKQAMFVFSMLTLLVASASSLAIAQDFGAESIGRKDVLVVIGYSDQRGLKYLNSPGDLFVYNYFYDNAVRVQGAIEETLLRQGLVPDRINKSIYTDSKKRMMFTILNVNVKCPTEVEAENKQQISSRRFLVCPEQMARLKAAKTYLEQNLKKYDNLIYIGHARHGRGLAIGPYLPDFTFDIQFYRPEDAGNLKDVFIAACDSEGYYKKKITEKTNVEFTSADIKGSQDVVEQLIPLVEKKIEDVILRVRQPAPYSP